MLIFKLIAKYGLLLVLQVGFLSMKILVWIKDRITKEKR